jgi:ribonuclease P protein component
LLSSFWTAPGACLPAVFIEDPVRAPGQQKPRQTIGPLHRLRTAEEYAAIKQGGIALRGRHFVLLTLAAPGSPSKVGFVASKKSVGNAVQRNRARRRLREIVRRRWSTVPAEGVWFMFIASRRTLTAPHMELLHDVEVALRDAVTERPEAV